MSLRFVPVGEEEEAAELLSRLVAIPSITLGRGERPPDARHGEGAMAEEIGRYLAEHGIPFEVEELSPGRPQLTARIGSGRPDLLITSHMDTVPPVDWGTDPFHPSRFGDRMYGLGACDDKGSLTAMLLAFTRLAAAWEGLPGTLTFVAMVGEEMFGVGSTHLAASGYRPDGAIVGEPTEMRLVRVECGNIRWQVHTLGRASHGSRPWEGDSAIYRMARVLRVLDEELAPDCRARSHSLVGSAALNAGLIQGGTAFNIVPDRCSLCVERRVLPGEDPLETMAAINRRLEEAAGPDHFRADAPVAVNHPLDTSEESAIVRAGTGALTGLGLNPTPTGVSFGSDANRLAAVQIPCILFGPGSIQQAHTRSEWVELRQVAAAARVLEDTARRFLRLSSG
jgi:acetylornithine deacetylase